MGSIGGYIEKRLKLVVNREKSQVARSERVKFLGMTLVGGTIAISHQALQAAMARVRELTPRGTPASGGEHRADQPLVRGFLVPGRSSFLVPGLRPGTPAFTALP